MNDRKIVLIEPENPENTGLIARSCANFGYQLRIVNPEFNISKARKTASKAQKILREAKIFETVEEAINDINFIVGTKPGRGVSINEFKASEETSIMIGRESSGLTQQELDMCDAVVHIPTKEYGSINQAQAAAIVMQKFMQTKNKESINRGQEKVLKKLLPGKAVEAIMEGNPSPEKIDSIIGEIKDNK